MMMMMMCLVPVFVQQKDGIMAILAAVLHISDIEFQTDPQTDGVFVANDDVLLLGQYSAVTAHYSLNFMLYLGILLYTRILSVGSAA